ncbi:MAG: TRAP transporter small permease [Gammaproteobacteria bacterium]|nr:TRAP transporter small permease [Gammaproteobacteria bacterium]
MQKIIKYLHRLEDGLLVALLSLLILLASTQILMRNFLDTGIVWIDPLLRMLVLWLSLIGAAVAAREQKHIQIDVLTRLLNPGLFRVVQTLVNLFCAGVCLTIAWSGVTWIKFDYEDQIISFLGIPAWIVEVIIPVSFAIIGIRFIGQAITASPPVSKPGHKQAELTK